MRWWFSRKKQAKADPKVSGKFRTIKSTVMVARTHMGGNEAFQACVYLGGEKAGSGVCAAGRNPRSALAAALKGASSKAGKRSGAFSGLKRKRRRR